MSLYAAIGLHSSNGVLAVMDGEGKALLQCRRPNDLLCLLSDLAPYREELAGVAVESTDNWYWRFDGLMDQGYASRLVSTTAIPQYDGLKHGDGHTDAMHPPGNSFAMPPVEIRNVMVDMTIVDGKVTYQRK